MAEAPAPVTIGFPVYNGERLMAQALDSLLGQSFGDFELDISDNASTDGTEEICRAYAARDARIRYRRRPVNAGVWANYTGLLHGARGRYFMWAAHDDLWDPTYVGRLKGLLDARPDCPLAFSGVDVIDARGERVFVYEGIERLGRPRERLRRMREVFWFPDRTGKPTIVYGLMRTAVAQRLELTRRYSANTWGLDFLIVLRLAGEGPFASTPEILFHKRERPFPRDESAPPPSPLERLAAAVRPPLPFSVAYLRDFGRMYSLMELTEQERLVLERDLALRLAQNYFWIAANVAFDLLTRPRR